jgi:cytidylate kinase
MNKNEKYVITINRELGSGGRTIGRKLAERLGVDFYDKAVIKGLQEKYHLNAEEIEALKGRSHTWWENFKRSLGLGEGWGAGNAQQYYQANPENLPDALTTDEMFKAETLILQDIAIHESCVVAGRLGFYVFRAHPNHLSILIQASMPFRIERLMRKQNMTEDEARETIEKVDQMRENYVKNYAKTSRYDTRNYDLVISVDDKTEDDIVDIILKYIG